MSRFFFSDSVVPGEGLQDKKQGVCLTISHYSQLNFFVFLL